MIKAVSLLCLIFSLCVDAGKKAKNGDNLDDYAVFEALLANLTKQVNINATSSNFRHQKSNKLKKRIQQLDKSQPHSKVETENDHETFATLFDLHTAYDFVYHRLESKNKQIEVKHNTTKENLDLQFDQISSQMESYQSKLDDINERKSQGSSQMRLFENTISDIEEFVKTRGSVQIDSGKFMALCNNANRALTVVDKNLQLFCTKQGKGSHITLETYLSAPGSPEKQTICSNTRVAHVRDAFDRVGDILRAEEQQKRTLSQAQLQKQADRIEHEIQRVIEYKNNIVNEANITLVLLEQESLSLKTTMSQLNARKESICKQWEVMLSVHRKNYIKKRFDINFVKAYNFVQFYINKILPLLIEQRVRWYASVSLCKLSQNLVRLPLFDSSINTTRIVEKYGTIMQHVCQSAIHMEPENLQRVYQRGNQQLSQYMEQMQNSLKHIESSLAMFPSGDNNKDESLLYQIREQLGLKLYSSTGYIPTITDWKCDMNFKIYTFGQNSSFELAFQKFALLGDVSDTKRHSFSFHKKRYDLVQYYQNKLEGLRKQVSQNSNARKGINLLEWYMFHFPGYELFLTVKAFDIDPTDQMMKSVFGLVAHRVDYLKEKKIVSMEFYQQIINKTYINHWRNSSDIIEKDYIYFFTSLHPFLVSL